MWDDAKTLLAYWKSLPVLKSGFRAWDDFHPKYIAAILPRFSLLKAEGDQNIIVRLVGQELVENSSYNMTGHNVFGVYAPEMRPVYAKAYAFVFEQKCGVHFVRSVENADGVQFQSDTLYLPVSNKNNEMFLVGVLTRRKMPSLQNPEGTSEPGVATEIDGGRFFDPLTEETIEGPEMPTMAR